MLDKINSKRKTILIDKDVYIACNVAKAERGIKLYEYINMVLAKETGLKEIATEIEKKCYKKSKTKK